MTGPSLGQRDRPYVAEHSDHSSDVARARTGRAGALTGAQDRCEHSGDAAQPVGTAGLPPLWPPLTPAASQAFQRYLFSCSQPSSAPTCRSLGSRSVSGTRMGKGTERHVLQKVTAYRTAMAGMR